jgi:hypothetical protein
MAVAIVFCFAPSPGHAPFFSEDFKWGLYDYGVHLTDEEFDMVLGVFDRNGDGLIDFTEFLVTLRGEMNERRLIFIHEVHGVPGWLPASLVPHCSAHLPWVPRASAAPWPVSASRVEVWVLRH